MSIVVHNTIANTSIQVAINHWQTEGNTGYYTLKGVTNETYDRTYKGGFVMLVKIGKANPNPYYVLPASIIFITHEGVFYETSKGKVEIPVAGPTSVVS